MGCRLRVKTMGDDQRTTIEVQPAPGLVFPADLFGGVASTSGTPREIRNGVVRDGDQTTYGPRLHLIDFTTAEGRERHLTIRDADWTDGQRRTADRILNRSGVREHIREQTSAWQRVSDPTDLEAGASRADVPTVASVLARLVTATGRYRAILICTLETLRLSGTDRDRVLPVLWQYILDRRDSNDADEQVAVGAAIRKYVANMNVSQMDRVAQLFDAGHRETLPPSVELVLAKMVYRKYAANPPASPDPQPTLSEKLRQLATGYLHPSVLPKDKFAAVASLAVAALVAMRSEAAEAILREVKRSPFTWFQRVIARDMDRLAAEWQPRDAAAASWCANLKDRTLRA